MIVDAQRVETSGFHDFLEGRVIKKKMVGLRERMRWVGIEREKDKVECLVLGVSPSVRPSDRASVRSPVVWLTYYIHILYYIYYIKK